VQTAETKRLQCVRVLCHYFFDDRIKDKANAKRTKLSEAEMDSSTKVSECTQDSTTALGNLTSFPNRLMQMLDSGDLSGVMYWSGYGDSFCINTTEFGEKVLDVYFQGSKFESFVRKLNRWGFKRTYHPDFRAEIIGYQHRMFRKGRPELLTNLSNGKKQHVKSIAPHATLQQSTLLQANEAHLRAEIVGKNQPTGKSLLSTYNSCVPSSAAVVAPQNNLYAVQRQQHKLGGPMTANEVVNANSFRGLLLQHLSQVSPSSIRQAHHDLPSMMLSRQYQQAQQQQQFQNYLTQRVSASAPSQALRLPHDPLALQLFGSAHRFPMSSASVLPTLAAESRLSMPGGYEISVNYGGQLYITGRHSFL